MARQTYEIVRHDAGWAYRVGDVYSEPFATHEAARQAAEAAAQRQQLSGTPHDIEFEDENGTWHRQTTSGDDHPDTEVSDKP